MRDSWLLRLRLSPAGSILGTRQTRVHVKTTSLECRPQAEAEAADRAGNARLHSSVGLLPVVTPGRNGGQLLRELRRCSFYTRSDWARLACLSRFRPGLVGHDKVIIVVKMSSSSSTDAVGAPVRSLHMRAAHSMRAKERAKGRSSIEGGDVVKLSCLFEGSAGLYVRTP